MTDANEEYHERVRRRLARREDEPVMRAADVLCFPSFHPETFLGVASGAGGITSELTSFTSSLWHSEHEPTARRPDRVQEVAPVSPERAARLWDAIEALVPEAVREERGFGLDGMTVRASYRHGQTAMSFEAWSPDPASASGRFIRLIYDLAWEVLKEPISIERLEQLHGYLHIGLPARFIEGDVRCLRIFGLLSSYDRKGLKKLFGSLPVEEPLVVDMTNFDGMGTRLYPTFIEFASPRRLLAWVGSTAARRHIEAMGLPSPHVFDAAEDAIEWVRRMARPSDSGEVHRG